ncbi:MAG: eIF2A-related protein [Nostoc sp. ChiQUE02]|uniref:WD40 domain-containing protein n=1 Tax=Nostoc sp. ChiQUE02 TaxID=3075377 RepID=UPI002AD5777B|nr:hypothetical protein [Nostoc sp. ChiQUE02]MDZ8232195.1 hypothetical protein [Nostoc sp. ChiQUE02]
MSDLQPLAIDNENSLQELAWAIATSQGEFSLILALCNAANLRKRLVQSLQASSDLEIREIVLDKSIKTFFQTIQDSLGLEHPQALVVSGLEAVTKLELVLSAANQVREELRKNFHFPLVLWVTDEVLHKLMRLAPDLHSWSTTVEFAIATDDLIDFIQQTANEVFDKVLAAGAGRYLDNSALNLQIGSPRRVELESAWHDLQNRRLSLNPELEASLEFMLGRATSSSLELSGQHYERSLALFGQESLSPQFLEKRACLLYSMGLWWRTYAVLHHPERDQARSHAKDYFQQSIEVFEQANRQDLVAKFINALGSVLQSLQRWEELEVVANKALALHQTYPDQFKLARAYSFMAEVAIAKSAWHKAKETAQQALFLLDSVSIDTSNPISEEMKADLDWERSYHRGWYLFALARSQSALNLPEAALETLETAKTQTKPQYDPELYIHILADLRASYFQKGEYLTAFHLKQEQRSIEQQYGLRAFIGAGRLQPQQMVNNPGLPAVEQQATVATEIAASGRQQDIIRLIERMGQSDRKLTIIHGQSGVGKSSILQAGLIPALKQKSIATRDVVPVLQQVYPDWIGELNNRLRDALCYLSSEVRGEAYSPPLLEEGLGQRAILKQLAKHDDYNLLTVLIFDQFEEFFFIYKDPTSRKPFYEFLRECLDIPFVKVILSLREDYVYYLLECNNRLANFEVINNNILDKDILYHLDNFSVEDTKQIIQTLTQKSQLVLETSLIDELVNDLARDLGEVRPIELQVVGAQLQTEKITNLEQYQQHGPKENFVGRFLEEIVKDCGSDNEQIAKLVLYLLTDENNTRPLKTRADLELELDVKSQKLDLVLEILIKSGLVLRVPASPADRYQLVHDYLVPFVRQQQSARLIAELEKEREQRKLTEAKLNEVLQQQLLETRRGLVWKVALGTITGGLAILLPLVWINQNNFQLASTSARSINLLKSNQDLEALVESIKAGKRLQQWWSVGVKPETEMQVKTVLQDAVYTIKERNRLEGYSDAVTSVSFSPDGKMLASGTADGTVKIWSSDGREISTFKAHERKITSVSISPDSQKIVSVSEDKTLKLWTLKDKKINSLKEITAFKEQNIEITTVAFSPNSQKLLTGSADGIMKLWSLNTQEVKTFKGHKDTIISASFSPDGKTIVYSSADSTVKLWDLDTQEIKKFNCNCYFSSVSFSPDGQTIAATGISSEEGTILWRRDGYRLQRIAQRDELISFSPVGNTITLTNSSDNNPYNENRNIVSAKLYDLQTKYTTDFELKGHKDKVTSISISPDGQMIASGSEDQTVKLWSLKIRNFTNSDNSGVSNLSFSPDGQLVASVSNNNKLHLWQSDGTLRTTILGSNSEFNFSGNSQMLASASQDSTLQLWRSNGSFITTLKGKYIDGSFSTDGRTIALVKDDNSVELLTSDGKHIKNLLGHKDEIYLIRFSPDGETLATASNDKTIKIWRRNGDLIKTLEGYSRPINNIEFSFHGETLVVSDQDNEDNQTLKFLQQNGKSRTLKVDDHDSVTFSPDGEILAIRKTDGDTQKIELRRMSGNLITTFQIQDANKSIYIVGFTRDSQTIVTYYNEQNKVQFWSREGKLISTFDKATIQAYSPDFQTLVTVEGTNKVKLVNRYGTPIRTIQVRSQRVNLEESSGYSRFSFSPDGKTLAIRTDFNNIEIWRIDDGTLITTLKGSTNQETERFSNYGENLPISFSSDSKTLVIRTAENSVQFWRIDTKKNKIPKLQSNWVKEILSVPHTDKIAIVGGIDTVKLWQLPDKLGKEAQLLQTFKGHDNLITSVSISPDSQIIASASKDNTVKLWRRNSKGRFESLPYKTFTGHKNKVNSVSFSPDGQLIASASADKTVKIWRPVNGEVIKEFKEHRNNITSISFSPNGQLIASASKDNSIKIWSLKDKDSKTVTIDNDEPATRVIFSPDGQQITTASWTKVKLWSIDGTPLTTFERFGWNDVSYSPDGKSIASGGNKISVWNFDLKELLKRGCVAARDYLKNNPKAESDRYLCDDIYKKSEK